MCSPHCRRRNNSPRSKPCCRPVSTLPPRRQTLFKSTSSPHVNIAVSRALTHDRRGDPTFADAILDCLVHNAYKLKLKGESMRKKNASLTQADH